MNRISWYLYRVRKMPVLEYPYRFEHAIKKKIDKFFIKETKLEFHSPYIENIKKADISGFDKIFPNEKLLIVSSANNILNHHFNIFGIEKNFGNPIDWHLDSKTNKSWPLRFWGDIDYRDGKTIGGIKFGWELNRLHHFPQLAIAFSLTGNSKYKDEIFNQLESWLESNPYPKGINWIMGIELGIRIVNIIYTLKFLGDEPLTLAQQRLIVEFISLHGKHLYRYPSRYSSCSNHTIAEALGLFVAGFCFPGIAEANEWKNFGKKVLESEISHQLYPDGSSFEHTIPYLQFVIDHFLIYYLVCKENDEPYSKHVEDKLKSSFEFVSNILDKNGNYPKIGDEDNGYLLKLCFGEYNNFISLLNTGAVIFDKPEWILENSKFDQKTFFLLGKYSKNKWNKLREFRISKKLNSKYFKNSGLAVIRDKSNSEILFIGNSGPLGLRPLGAHGHADALSFWLSINGKPIFVDPGTYLYHGGGKWRDYFRSTLAHNTIMVDRVNQATVAADFIFKYFYNIYNPFLKETDSCVLWSAGHDGYKRLTDPVFHKREVTFHREEKQMIIKDYIDCNKHHLIECFFHMHPYCSVSLRDESFDIRCDEIKIRLEFDKKWNRPKIIKGRKVPLCGWYSPYFNSLQESYTLILNANINGSESFCSTIYLK